MVRRRPPAARARLAGECLCRQVGLEIDDDHRPDRAPDHRPRVAPHLRFFAMQEVAVRGDVFARLRRVRRVEAARTGARGARQGTPRVGIDWTSQPRRHRHRGARTPLARGERGCGGPGGFAAGPGRAGRCSGRRASQEARPAKESPIARQRKQTLAEMLEEIPTACDRGAKCNAKGYKIAWHGYKLHIDTADCGVPISALLSSASVHDSRAAVPLSLMSAQRVTSLYDVMDAAYCSVEIQEHSRSLGHVPLIDHNPRGGLKDEFEPADAIRYKERTVAERSNARLKDEFGGRNVMVKGAVKVMSHLMFGVLALSADQLIRLRR